jgi:lipopolysaccharide export system protein LptA
MRRRPEPFAALVVLVPVLALGAGTDGKEPAVSGSPFDASTFGKSKEPITITSDRLEYDYKANVVVYRGDVIAIQGETKVRSDTMTVTFVSSNGNGTANGAPPPSGDPPVPGAQGQQRLRQVVAVGNVRIDNGTRWATGGRAVFEQTNRTVVLTEDPVMHDGPNEVAGERVIVYLDENRSEVEGGRKRVKAVVYPSQEDENAAGHPAKDGVAKDGVPKEPASTAAAGAATP